MSSMGGDAPRVVVTPLHARTVALVEHWQLFLRLADAAFFVELMRG